MLEQRLANLEQEVREIKELVLEIRELVEPPDRITNLERAIKSV